MDVAKQNDITSPLLRLPAELRLKIYEAAILSQLHEAIRHSPGVHQVPEQLAPLTNFGNLLTTCHQIRSDCHAHAIYNRLVEISVIGFCLHWREMAPMQIAQLGSVDLWPTSYSSEDAVKADVKWEVPAFETIPRGRGRLWGCARVEGLEDVRWVAFVRRRWRES